MATFDQRELRNVLGSFVTGVTIITAVDKDGSPRGVTVNSFSSVSLEPPLVLWSQALTAASYPVFRDAGRFVVNILAEDQVHLSKQFSSRDVTDRFAGVPVRTGLGGVPILEGCSAFLECRSFATYPGGDHAVFLGEVENFERTERKPLAFGGGRYMVAYAHEAGAATAEEGAESLVQLKAVRMAIAAAPELCAKTRLSVLVSVWGNRGTTAVHWETPSGEVHDRMGLGLVMSTLDSATGQLFAAHLPREQMQPILDEERSALLAAGLTAPRQDELEAMLGAAKSRGLTMRTSSEYAAYDDRPNRATFSAPIFDQGGKIVAAVSLTGKISSSEANFDHPGVRALAECAAALSKRMGYPGR